MAYADYYLSDVCGRKTFYDANLPYGEWGEENSNPRTKHLWPDGNIGWMLVICRDCADRFSRPIENLEGELGLNTGGEG